MSGRRPGSITYPEEGHSQSSPGRRNDLTWVAVFTDEKGADATSFHGSRRLSHKALVQHIHCTSYRVLGVK
jgi:hypothetical protein